MFQPEKIEAWQCPLCKRVFADVIENNYESALNCCQ